MQSCGEHCSEKELRGCRFAENKNNALSDVIEGTDIVTNCVVETYLDYPHLWSFFVDYTYSNCKKSLYKMDFIFGFIIQ